MPLILACLFCLFSAGCTSSNPPPPSRLPSSPTLGGARQAPPKVLPKKRTPLPATFFLVRLLNHDGTQPVEDRLVKTYEIRFQYPEFPNPELAPLNQAIAASVSTQRQRMMDWGGFLDETTLASGTLPWQSQLQTQVIHSQDDFISLLFVSYEYAGGTSGITSLNSFNYDVHSQTLLQIEDLFSSIHALSTLTTIVRQQLNRQSPNPTTTDWIEQITGESWEDFSCFGLTPHRLVIFLQSNPMAVYPLGLEKIEIPLGDLQPLVSPEKKDFWERLMHPAKPSVPR
ncbi:MAG TPA: hypothetical protein P5186_05680 [Candidatus Paceibacterota bacterium]|nr:hypothetical protein [Candidatus Paceibacterota bacterium]